MKIIREYTIKVIIMIISFVVSLEVCNLLYIYFTSKTIYKKTYDETLKRTEEKSLEITSSIKNFTANYFLKFVTELKKIAKYTLLYNGKSENNYTNIINRNSQFILNNNMQKKIIKANIGQLFTTPEFFKIYKETGQLNELGLPTDTSNLNYIKYYSQVFGEEKDKNKILKKLLKEHDELNYISYHYYGNNHTYDINSDHEKEELIKNILVIIKTIFIQRMLTKKTRMDIIRFLIITNEDMFIYPPEDYRKINLINFRTINPSCQCTYTSTNLNDYPSCIYNCIINQLFADIKNDVLIVKEKIEYQDVFASICIKFPFKKDDPDKSLLCLEIDFSSIIGLINLSDTKIFEFGLFNPISIPSLGFKDIVILFENKKDIYYQLFDVFNSSGTTPAPFLLNRSDITKPLKYFSLYHFIYFNVTKGLKEYPELNIENSKLLGIYIC